MCLPLRHIGLVELQLLSFITSALNGCECSFSYPVSFAHWKQPPPPTHLMGGLMDPRTGEDFLRGREIFASVGKRTPDRQSISLDTVPT